METFEGTYKRTFEYMEEVIPIENVQIVLNGNYLEAYSVDNPHNVSIKYEDHKTTITIKSLNIWETVIIMKTNYARTD